MDNSQQIESGDKPQASLQTVTKQDLIMIVAEKVKQIKSLSLKNSKLQSKYISVYKQHKLYKKDYETLLEFLKLVFDPLPEKPLGAIEFADLQLMWVERQARFNEKLRGLLQEVNKQKKHSETVHKQELEELFKKEHSRVETLEKELSDSLANLNKEKAEIAELKSRFDHHEEEIAKLKDENTKLQMQIKRTNDHVTEEHKSKEQDKDTELHKERQENIQLTKDLEDALEKIEEFREKIQDLEIKVYKKNRQYEILKSTFQMSKAQFSKIKSKMEEPNQAHHKPENGNKSGKKTKPNNNYQSEDKEYIQKEYLKNVFIRFMKCLNQNNYMQAQMLENVLMTILDFNTRQRETSALKPKQWWNIFE